MKKGLSVLIISKNNEDTIEKTLRSLKSLTSQIILIDEESTDSTVRIAKLYNVEVYQKVFNNIGKQRAFGLKFVTNPWVLILDSDEVVSKELKKEIKSIADRNNSQISGFEIPYQSYFLDRPLNRGGEDYKQLRFFKTNYVKSLPTIIHNEFYINGKIGTLKNKIHHYSYRSIPQVYSKFTDYAIKMAKVKQDEGETSSIRKVIMYPLHMFYARFIKDKGYKDGLFRIPLDLAFAYMEFLTYILLAFKPKKK